MRALRKNMVNTFFPVFLPKRRRGWRVLRCGDELRWENKEEQMFSG